ncbi:BglG family transcription antiterminator LicT [Enterococcus sp.]|uniref:BglG family transcription antiterminator LicT n=1 Tax=Enterococcus sp. TaxID=35783 RepID=UPI002897294B|nr:PRD domain-containing protein [Enterococcus sp.]
MIINKVLNNNVVITSDADENEMIVMGRGIAFKKKVGDRIPEETVDKVYRLDNPIVLNQFQELVADLPVEYLELSNQIIEYARGELTSPINDTIYISLTDHMHSAIERAKKGVTVKNVLLWDIKRFFPDEYRVGQKTIEKIGDMYGVDLPDDEAGFVALHLVNAQTENEDQGNIAALTQTMQEIINIVKYFFKTTFDEDSVYFYRFTTHLRFFVSRMLNQTQHRDETDEELLAMVRQKYHNAFQCVQKINTFLLKKYAYQMSSDEQMYLTIHIARLVQKNR